jgi:methyl-accepting chemotaxis protein
VRRAYSWLLGLTVSLTLVAVVLEGLVVLAVRDASSARNTQIEAVLLADEVRQSSDDLTNLARLYVLTGDERYRAYFESVPDIRSGQAPAGGVRRHLLGLRACRRFLRGTAR